MKSRVTYADTPGYSLFRAYSSVGWTGVIQSSKNTQNLMK